MKRTGVQQDSGPFVRQAFVRTLGRGWKTEKTGVPDSGSGLLKSDTAKKGKFFFLNLSILRVNIVGHGFRHFRVNGPVKGEGAGAVDPID